MKLLYKIYLTFFDICFNYDLDFENFYFYRRIVMMYNRII